MTTTSVDKTIELEFGRQIRQAIDQASLQRL
jgi:hypothetical protein